MEDKDEENSHNKARERKHSFSFNDSRKAEDIHNNSYTTDRSNVKI